MLTYILPKLAKKYGDVAEFLYYFPLMPILGDIAIVIVIILLILIGMQ